MPPPAAACPTLTAGRPLPALAVRSAALASAAPTLDSMPTGQSAVVRSVHAPAAAPEWAQWLDEIGFMPGERVMVMARGVPGGDPLVVRIGNSTFALRRAEAACVRLELATP